MPESKANPVAERLRTYWQMEAGNVVFVPASAGGLVLWSGAALNGAFVIAAIACGALLVVGALYWRAIFRNLQGDPSSLKYWLPRLAAFETPSIVLSAAATLAVIAGVMLQGWSASNIAAVVLAVLAVLEYINYYQVQLQHFDNAADWRRLLSGRGFRKAHLARDIAAWRAKQALRD